MSDIEPNNMIVCSTICQEGLSMLRPVYTCDFSCDFDAILHTKPAPAYPALVFSRVSLRRNAAKLAGIGKKGVFK